MNASMLALVLITGVVRDQTGAPIAGAVVSAQRSDGPPIEERTGSDGTFVLDGADGSTVRITCSYCIPMRAPVGEDGTVVAIVQRHQALANIGPSRSDLAGLPYSRITSSLSLAPFVVLSENGAPVYGDEIADRGVQRSGIAVDHGFTNYDIIWGSSPFITIPERYTQSAAVLGQSDAYAYGNSADGGTFVLDPHSDDSDALAQIGPDAAFRAGISTASFALSGGFSHDTGSVRRADEDIFVPVGGGTLTLRGLQSNGDTPTVPELQASESAVGLDYERDAAISLHTDAYMQRNSDEIDDPHLYWGWSDSGVDLSLSGRGIVTPFAAFGTRATSGFLTVLNQDALVLDQAHETFGVHVSGTRLNATAAIARYDLAYAFSNSGKQIATTADIGVPALQLNYKLSPQWSIDASASGGFTLPTLLATITQPPYKQTFMARDGTIESTLTYTDNSRVRVAVTAISRSVHGANSGKNAAAGVSLAWQIAPQFSLRAWYLHDTPTIPAYGAPIIGPQKGTSVGSAWLTYENTQSLRVDAIWRQDIFGLGNDAHLDGALSIPLTKRLRWYIETERYRGNRSVTSGLRF